MFKCPYPGCEHRSPTLGGIKSHYWRVHTHPHCWVCDKYFSTRQALVNHAVLKVKHGDEAHLAVYWLAKKRANTAMNENYRDAYRKGGDMLISIFDDGD